MGCDVTGMLTAELTAETIVDVGAMGELAAEWDALAVANAMPLMSPGWILPWWRHIAPDNAEPRVVAVRDGSELIGLAPFYVALNPHRHRIDYRLCGIATGGRMSPLATSGREWEVAGAVARALEHALPRPDLVALEAGPVASPWPTALRDGWPGAIRPSVRLYQTRRCPVVCMREDSFDSWLAGRSAKFRSSMRRLSRRFDEAGGSSRMSTDDTFRADIATFMRLHLARWEGRESGMVSFGAGLPAMLEEAARMLPGEGRFRLWVAEVAGEPISADLYLAAGGEILGWNGGWSERFRKLSPPLLATMRTIKDGFERGDRRLDMGLGDESHKTRFTDANDPVAWSILMPLGRRLPLTAMRTTPLLARSSARATAKRVLAPEQVDRLRAARRLLTRS